MNNLIFRKGLVFGLIIIIIGINMIPLTEGMRKEKNYYNTEINGIYYLRDDDPMDWEDVGSLLMGQSIENETTRCGMFINFHFAQSGIFNAEKSIKNIYYHLWQKSFEQHIEYEIGYSTSSEHAAGFNESIWIDMDNYITDVNDFRLIQAYQTTDPEIAIFNGDEIYNFTIKLFGPNPNILCSPRQQSFVILNLEDNETLLKLDRDNDKVSDFEELYIYFTNPFDKDTDGDGYSDYNEVNNGADPNDYQDNFEGNFPTYPPTITGPQEGKIGIKYDYKFKTTDPEENYVYYYIVWGDDQNEQWIGHYSSGEEVIISHIWKKNGQYTIMAKARDYNGAESDWAELNVNIPRTRIFNNPFLKNLLEKMPIIKKVLSIIS
jgi:hypothetical protein